MTWYLFDSNGYVGDLATIKGLADLRTFILRTSKNHYVKDFFNQGYSTHMVELQKEFKQLHSPNTSINNTMQNLVELLGKCEDVAIINDGIEEDK